MACWYYARITPKLSVELWRELGGDINMWQVFKHVTEAFKLIPPHPDNNELEGLLYQIMDKHDAMRQFRYLTLGSSIPAVIDVISLGSANIRELQDLPCPPTEPGEVDMPSENMQHIENYIAGRWPGINIKVQSMYLSDS